MFKLILENHLGERIQLTQNRNYAVTDVDGLNPPKANINMGENANFDGATFNSSKLNTRNIVISVRPIGNVEENRIALYRFVKSKKNIKVYFTNRTRNVYITGYVSACEVDLFKKGETMQISIICPDPYFRENNSFNAEASGTVPLFEFEMDIASSGIEFSYVSEVPEVIVTNYGDVETGAIIDIMASGTAVNPVVTNETTQAQMRFNITLTEGQTLRINTNKGQKSVKLLSYGTETNVISCLDISNGAEWITLESGNNTLSFDASSGGDNINCYISYDNLYEGV